MSASNRVPHNLAVRTDQQPPKVREAFQFCLAVAPEESGKGTLSNTIEVGGRPLGDWKALERSRAMEKAVGELSAEEFEELVERTIDRRLQVWLTQLADALIGLEEEEKGTELRPEFAASLRCALEQARLGEGIDPETFREQIGR